MGTTTDYKEKYLKSFFKWQAIYENACQRTKELEKKLKIAEKALTDVCLYRYDVSDTDQEDWFKIATCMAEVAGKAKEKIKE